MSVFAETLIGLTNTFGCLTGFIAPAVVGTVTNRNVRTASCYGTVEGAGEAIAQDTAGEGRRTA